VRLTIIPLAAAFLACAGAGPAHRSQPAAPAAESASDRATRLAQRMSEGMNCVAAAAVDWPLLRARGDEAHRGWAREGVTALREVCGPGKNAASPGELCARINPKLDALERAASTPGAPEAIRAAAREVVAAMAPDFPLPPGLTVDRFLQVSAGLSLVEQIASDRGWRELIGEPEPALRASVQTAAAAIGDVCSDPSATPRGWDCTRALPQLEALRRLAGEAPVDERVREPARALLDALQPAPPAN
jgi:hypothetical protein